MVGRGRAILAPVFLILVNVHTRNIESMRKKKRTQKNADGIGLMRIKICENLCP